MKVRLNIGMQQAVGNGIRLLSGFEVQQALHKHGFTLLSNSRYEASSTEMTLVVDVDSKYDPAILFNHDRQLRSAIYALSVTLGQDCIAFAPINFFGRCLTTFGRLVGPNKDKWGEFNAQYFLK